MVDDVAHDLELTVSALKDGPAALGISGGLLEIDRWEQRLADSGTPALQELGSALAEPRGELESDEPDPDVLADLMRRLGGAPSPPRPTGPRVSCAPG